MLIVYFLETGLVLLVVPWLTVWDQNLLVEVLPGWGTVARLHAVRGLVSGVGLVSFAVGFWELAAAVRRWLRRRRGAGSERLAPPGGGVDSALAEEAGSWSQKP